MRKACAGWRANVADELRALAAEKGGRFARRRAEAEAVVGEAAGRSGGDAEGGGLAGGERGRDVAPGEKLEAVYTLRTRVLYVP